MLVKKLTSKVNANFCKELAKKFSTDVTLVKKLAEKFREKTWTAKIPKLLNGERKNFIKNVLYEAGVEDPIQGEYDSLIILPTTRQIIDLEVKSVKEGEATIEERIWNAAQQTAKRKLLLGQHHGDILSSNWTYWKALAFPRLHKLPEETQNKVCADCLKYILYEGDPLGSLEKFEDWFQRIADLAPRSNFHADHEYFNLLTRIIGFFLMAAPDNEYTHLLPTNERFREVSRLLHKSVLGKEDATCEAEVEMPTDESEETSALCSIKTRYHWNPLQTAVLLKDKKTVFLKSENGTGKTYLLKFKALELAENLKRQRKTEKIFFVSLAQLDVSTHKYLWNVTMLDHYLNIHM